MLDLISSSLSGHQRFFLYIVLVLCIWKIYITSLLLVLLRLASPCDAIAPQLASLSQKGNLVFFTSLPLYI